MKAYMAAVLLVAGCGGATRAYVEDGHEDAAGGSLDAAPDSGTDSMADAPATQDAGTDALSLADSGEDGGAEPDATDGGAEDVCIGRFCGSRDAGCAPRSCGGACGRCSANWSCIDGRCVEDPPPPGRCRVRCDCEQGQECSNRGADAYDPETRSYPCRDYGIEWQRYCCDKPGCPSGQLCQRADGSDGPGDGTRWACPNVIFCPGDPRC